MLRTSQDLTPSQSGGAGQAGEKGIEADNYEFGNDSEPRSNPALSNFTIVGDRRSGPGGGNGIQLRRGTSGAILNSIVWNHEQQGLRITDVATWTAACNAGFPQPGLYNACSQIDVPPWARGNVFLSRGVPNPFHGSVAFRFSLPRDSRVRVRLFTAGGREVAGIPARDLEAGEHSITWQAEKALPNGLYFYRVEAGELVSQGKLIRVD